MSRALYLIEDNDGEDIACQYFYDLGVAEDYAEDMELDCFHIVKYARVL